MVERKNFKTLAYADDFAPVAKTEEEMSLNIVKIKVLVLKKEEREKDYDWRMEKAVL